jgi:predicted phage gp36 major capsid-like protein
MKEHEMHHRGQLISSNGCWASSRHLTREMQARFAAQPGARLVPRFFTKKTLAFLRAAEAVNNDSRMVPRAQT